MVIYRRSNPPWTESGLKAIRAFNILRLFGAAVGEGTFCPSRSPEDIYGPIILPARPTNGRDCWLTELAPREKRGLQIFCGPRL